MPRVMMFIKNIESDLIYENLIWYIFFAETSWAIDGLPLSDGQLMGFHYRVLFLNTCNPVSYSRYVEQKKNNKKIDFERRL